MQASEKSWGAVAQIIKALAAKESKDLENHGDLWRYVNDLVKNLGGSRAEALVALGELSTSKLLRKLDAPRKRQSSFG